MFHGMWRISCVPRSRWPASYILGRATANRGRRHIANATEIVQELKNRKLPVRIDHAVPGPASQLNYTLSDFLSPNKRVRLGPPVPLREPRLLYPGYHLVYFPPLTTESNLLEDGTDVLHAPDRSWKYRLWAGGSVEIGALPRLGHFPFPLALVERIADVKVRGSKVFVQIERAVVSTKSEKRDGLIDDEAKERLRALAFPSSEGDPTVGHPAKSRDIFVRETRWLCFMKEKPPTPELPPGWIPPPEEEAFYKTTMTPTPALLFRFSALTFNAHAIHLDPEYTKNVYGLPERLVQGPLTLALMLQVAGRAVSVNARHSGPNYSPSEIHYKNIAPIYVNEQISIICRHPEPAGDGDGPDAKAHMHVYIQKIRDGQPVVCVDAKVTLRENPHGTESSGRG